MIEREIEIPKADGTCDGVLFRPDGDEVDESLPGVLFLTDIGGIRESQRQMARRLAAEGYAVLMPNLFYRTARPPIFTSFPKRFDDEATQRRLAELRAPLTPEVMERDASDSVDFLAAQEGTSGGGMGVVGFCFAGAMAMRAAAARPDRIAAAASFHGGGLATDSPASPHLLLPRIQARLYFGHAVEDRGMPPEAVARLDAALAAWGGVYESRIYEGARHGWTVPDNPTFNPAQAERAFEALTGLLAETLKAG